MSKNQRMKEKLETNLSYNSAAVRAIATLFSPPQRSLLMSL